MCIVHDTNFEERTQTLRSKDAPGVASSMRHCCDNAGFEPYAPHVKREQRQTTFAKQLTPIYTLLALEPNWIWILP